MSAQVHDVQFDYYGRRLATCSSDRTIKVTFLHHDKRCPRSLANHLRNFNMFSFVLVSAMHISILWETLTGVGGQVFETAGDQMAEVSQLVGHEGPVWQVTWAHPKFGSLLASCGFDHKVIVWKESQESHWVQVRSLFLYLLTCLLYWWLSWRILTSATNLLALSV